MPVPCPGGHHRKAPLPATVPASNLRKSRISAGLRLLRCPGVWRLRSIVRYLFQLPRCDAAQPGGSGGRAGRGAGAGGRARLIQPGRFPGPGRSFRQATKSSPLGESGLKFSREEEAGFLLRCASPVSGLAASGGRGAADL